MDQPNHDFTIETHPNRVSAEDRAALLANPGFGRVFTDHMAVVRYTEGRGWHDAKITARGPIPLDPATSVLHYAQEIFEGLKAYRAEDGGAVLFRPEANARRFRQSAERMAMPVLPEATFIEAVRQVATIDRNWIPDDPDGSLYMRPFMFASEVFLGVKPSSEYLFLVIASPVGAYFKGGAKAVSIWVSDDYVRAAPGGTGAAKYGGNYAASLKAQQEAIENGCDQVVFLDAVDRQSVDELGGMNVFFVMNDGTLLTPPLNGSILPGVTRDSLMTLARDAGMNVREENYTIDRWSADAATGRLAECFACGTAAVVTPIGTVKRRTGSFTIGGGKAGEVSTSLRQRLVDIQRGKIADPHGWVQRLF
jgi:branched-chain amino acid aminotransferase